MLVRVLVSAAVTLLRSVLVVGDSVLPVPVGGCATVSGGRAGNEPDRVRCSHRGGFGPKCQPPVPVVAVAPPTGVVVAGAPPVAPGTAAGFPAGTEPAP